MTERDEPDVLDIEQEARAEVVRTGAPEIQLLACTECGVLLWDIDAHYRQAHPPALIQGDAPGPASGTKDERAAREAAYQEAKLASPHWRISEHGAFEVGWNARAEWRHDPAPATRETLTEEMVERAARAAYDRAFLKHAPEDVDRWDDLVADNDAAAESWRRVARSALEAALGAKKGDD